MTFLAPVALSGFAHHVIVTFLSPAIHPIWSSDSSIPSEFPDSKSHAFPEFTIPPAFLSGLSVGLQLILCIPLCACTSEK